MASIDVNESASGSNISTRSRNGIIQPLLTDLYQITMAYAYWKSDKRDDIAVFDLFFRKNPFQGEFTLFAGLEECLKLLDCFQFSESDVDYIRSIFPADTEPAFFDYLRDVNTDNITLYAVPEGTVVFPKVPLLVIQGPLPIVQLMETTMLNLINYASLVATNAARFRLAAGEEKTLLEFGLRRAQGPDGGLSASRYCYMGGFDGTSNVLAGKMYGIPVRGTHAHAFVTSYIDLNDIKNRQLKKFGTDVYIDFVDLCLKWQKKLESCLAFLPDQVIKGELAAFISYAQAFPNGFMALIDTYDVIRSGLPNFCTVGAALKELGYTPVGVRLDSGDLAYLSKVVKAGFDKVAAMFDLPVFSEGLTIVASNDINEETILSLNQQLDENARRESIGNPNDKEWYRGDKHGHAINSFGIGTHLVTCQKQPALGCVFKLVEINEGPRIKLSEDMEKVTIPGRKLAYRLYGADGLALVDLMQQPNEVAPSPGRRTLCRHPFNESKRAYVSPSIVEPLHTLYWKDGQLQQPLVSLQELREKAARSLNSIRPDIKRSLNPTPYKVSVTGKLYSFIHDLWLEHAPIGELS